MCISSTLRNSMPTRSMPTRAGNVNIRNTHPPMYAEATSTAILNSCPPGLASCPITKTITPQNSKTVTISARIRATCRNDGQYGCGHVLGQHLGSHPGSTSFWRHFKHKMYHQELKRNKQKFYQNSYYRTRSYYFWIPKHTIIASLKTGMYLLFILSKFINSFFFNESIDFIYPQIIFQYF